MTTIAWPHGFNSIEVDISQITALPAGWDWYSIQSLGDELIAFGENGTQFCIASLDSPTGSWTLGTASSDADLLAALPDKCARLGTTYAVMVGTTKVATCTSLGAWTVSTHDLPTSPGSPFYFGLGADASYFYTVGMNSSGGWNIMVLRSANAVNWTLRDTQASPSWQVINNPVEFDGNIHAPVSTIGGGPTWPDPYCVFDRAAPNLTQAQHEFANGDPFNESNGPSAITLANGALLMAAVTPGNASGLYVLTAEGAVPQRVGYLYALGPDQYTAAGFGGISGLALNFQYVTPPGLYGDLAILDEGTGEIYTFDDDDIVAQFTLLEAEHAAGSTTQDNWFVGPLFGNTVIQVIDGTTAERRLYTMPDITLPGFAPEIEITELPTTYTGITLVTRYGNNSSGEDFESTDLYTTLYRAGAAIFTITVPPGTVSIRMEFQEGFDPNGYIDIFAAQGGTYETLSENYDADYYNYFYADEPGLRVQNIPVSGTTPLTIVFQGWDIYPEGGGLDVTFAAQSFWTGFTNCEAT